MLWLRAGGPPDWTNTTRGLYDVANDPREMHDLQTEKPDVVASLMARFLHWCAVLQPAVSRRYSAACLRFQDGGNGRKTAENERELGERNRALKWRWGQEHDACVEHSPAEGPGGDGACECDGLLVAVGGDARAAGRAGGRAVEYSRSRSA